jgi:hypothetical protein
MNRYGRRAVGVAGCGLSRLLLAVALVALAGPPASVAGEAASAEPQAPASPPPSPQAQAVPKEKKAKVSGDFRVRYEKTTFPGPEALDRNRGVLRARLALDYSVNDLLAFGGRLATGARDDPRTTDVTINDFGKDLEINLDRAFMKLSHGGLEFVAGRFPNPFVSRTEMVWDGDVNPQGAGGTVKFPSSGELTFRVTGLLFLIDEQAAGPDSMMGGGQLAIVNASKDWTLTLAAAYYDYEIKSLRNAGLNNIRGNNLDPSRTAYLSDFDLLDLLLDTEFRGLGPRAPLQLTAEYVKNFGAAVPEDQGVNVDFFAGRLKQRGDVRGRYGYARVERDAVLGTFSHDNIALATSYRLHTIAADWQVLPNTFLNVTWYLYRENEAADRVGGEGHHTRLRVNALVTF